MTIAPIFCSQRANQPPLNPVCPVMKTRFPAQNDGVTMFSTEPCRLAKDLQDDFFHARYPWVAKTHGASRQKAASAGQDSVAVWTPTAFDNSQ